MKYNQNYHQSLYKNIKSVINHEKISFHMPGHKYMAPDILNPFTSIYAMDTTEIEGTDNLHDAKGFILDAEKRISKVYSSKRSRILVGGSTVGILSSVFGLAKEGDKILIGRDSHKSVFNACKLKKLEYICVNPSLSKNQMPLDYDNVLEILREQTEIKIAVITSPSYYGYVREITEIGKLLNDRGGVLIVDEAHGAHLEFTPLKNLSALKQGAHVVIQSAHKNLPALTMTGILHYNFNLSEHCIDKIDEALRIFQSSSPSYPLMYSIDEAVSFMDENRDLAKKKYFVFKNFSLHRALPYIENFNSGERQDPFKLFVLANSLGISGYEVEKRLIERGIYPEFAHSNGVLLYLSAFNELAELNSCFDTIDELKARASCIKSNLKLNEKSSSSDSEFGECFKAITYPKITRFCKHRDYENKKIKSVKFDESLCKVSAEDIIPYPPGIPILLKGELISDEILNCLIELRKQDEKITLNKGNKLDEIKVFF